MESDPGFPGKLTSQNYLSVFSTPSAYQTILNSIFYSVGAAVFSIALASVLAIIVQRTDAPLRRITQLLAFNRPRTSVVDRGHFLDVPPQSENRALQPPDIPADRCGYFNS